MDEQTPEEKPEEREETIKDLDVPEEKAEDVKGGEGSLEQEISHLKH